MKPRMISLMVHLHGLCKTNDLVSNKPIKLDSPRPSRIKTYYEVFGSLQNRNGSLAPYHHSNNSCESDYLELVSVN